MASSSSVQASSAAASLSSRACSTNRFRSVQLAVRLQSTYSLQSTPLSSSSVVNNNDGNVDDANDAAAGRAACSQRVVQSIVTSPQINDMLPSLLLVARATGSIN